MIEVDVPAMLQRITWDYPMLLDLYCGAGGAAVGYRRAGFKIVGIDIHPQPHYPFEFHQLDALEALSQIVINQRVNQMKPGHTWPRRYDAIHASPPCQRHSRMSNCRPGLADDYPALIEPTRELLRETGLPYVIENVEGSPLIDPVMLCAGMFGRDELVRHRLFETNWPLTGPPHRPHTLPTSRAGHWEPGTAMSISGHIAPIAMARELMDIDWTTREELAEAIPPYYTEFVGAQLMRHITTREETA